VKDAAASVDPWLQAPDLQENLGHLALAEGRMEDALQVNFADTLTPPRCLDLPYLACQGKYKQLYVSRLAQTATFYMTSFPSFLAPRLEHIAGVLAHLISLCS